MCRLPLLACVAAWSGAASALVVRRNHIKMTADGPRVTRRGVLGAAAAAMVPGSAFALGLPQVDLPKVSLPENPLTTLVPQIPGVEVGGVEINPFKELDIDRPEVPDVTPIAVEELVVLARKGGVKSVRFLTANGDVAVATMKDGQERSVAVTDDKSGSFKLTAKLRDYNVPYTYSFDLSKFNKEAKKTSMRARNQNVLDAEARGREEAEKLREMDARLENEREMGERPQNE